MVEDVTDGATTSYLYGNNIDEVLQIKRGEDTYYYHTNHLGSIITISNLEGGIVERMNYNAFGLPTFFNYKDAVMTHSSIDNNILYSGREYDAESETYYYRARTMHPYLGRFIHKDPLMYIDGMNDYLYVKNLPIKYVDRTGESVQSTVQGFSLIAIGGIGGVAIASAGGTAMAAELASGGGSIAIPATGAATLVGMAAAVSLMTMGCEILTGQIDPISMNIDWGQVLPRANVGDKPKEQAQNDKNDKDPCKNGEWRIPPGKYENQWDCQCQNYPHLKNHPECKKNKCPSIFGN